MPREAGDLTTPTFLLRRCRTRQRALTTPRWSSRPRCVCRRKGFERRGETAFAAEQLIPYPNASTPQEEWAKHLEKLLSDLLDENGVIQVVRGEGTVSGRSEAGVAQVRMRLRAWAYQPRGTGTSVGCCELSGIVSDSCRNLGHQQAHCLPLRSRCWRRCMGRS